MNVERFARQCESSACSHRRRLWRDWLEPLRGYTLDGHWYCRPACFEQALASAITQFLPGAAQPPAAAHRVPLGLLMLSRGLVDNEQLKKALKAQKDSGSGRVGEWLRHMGAVSEEQVTQILGLQWSIPVFPLKQSRRFLECAHLVPLPLLEVAEMVPVHHIPTSQHLYVAFTDRINYSALYAVEKMLDCHTEPCLAVQSQVLQALKELRSRPRPVEFLMDSISDPGEMASAILAQVERLGASDVRISGFDGFIWARILALSGYTDILFQAQRNPPGSIVPEESPP
ncbi:MAG TPA: hypothetical protein VKO18_13820 [Terriglobia bacterium]|nr:hypothetical protein [Terriglobia bacterium]